MRAPARVARRWRSPRTCIGAWGHVEWGCVGRARGREAAADLLAHARVEDLDGDVGPRLHLVVRQPSQLPQPHPLARRLRLLE